MEMQELIDHLNIWKKAWPKLTRTALRSGGNIVAQEVKRRYTGGVLHEFTGRLARGVRYSTKLNPISAKVYVSNSQQYKAQTHEYGAVHVGKPFMTIAPAGTSKNAKGLFWGRPSSVVIPARPVMQDSVRVKQAEVLALIEKTIVDDVERRW
jgi:hypothetical protein